MLVYVLTQEPYHDNSSILGVYLDEAAGVAALKAAPDPSNINEDDYRLTEWDTGAGARERQWDMTGKQVYGEKLVPWSNRVESVPVRKEFTFTGPDEVICNLCSGDKVMRRGDSVIDCPKCGGGGVEGKP